MSNLFWGLVIDAGGNKPLYLHGFLLALIVLCAALLFLFVWTANKK